MGLLYVDGFDTYGNTNNATATQAAITNRWNAQNPATMRTYTGRDGGYSLAVTSSNQKLGRVFGTTNSTIVVGIALYMTSIGGSAFAPIYLRTSQTNGMNVRINTDGSISVLRDTTVLGTSTNTGVISTSTWHYVEFKVLADNSSGTYEVRVDGVNEISGTGADTQGHASFAYHDSIELGRGLLSSNVQFDDLYILDGAGTDNTDFLGHEVWVRTLWPNGDDTSDWTPTGASNNYDQINSEDFDDTTYVESNTSADQDIYDYEGLANTGEVHGVQVTTVAQDTDAKSIPMKVLAKSTGNTVNSGNVAFGSTDWDSRSVIFEEDPDGAAWTQATVNSTAFGVELT